MTTQPLSVAGALALTDAGPPALPSLSDVQPLAVADLSTMPVTPAPAAFVWGNGGRRMTPDELAAARKQAQQLELSGMDYSPVQSWTQGLTRVAQGLVGGIEERRLRKQADAQAAHSQTILDALTAGSGGDSSVAAALADPYADPGVKEYAKLRFQADHKAPPALPEVVQLSQIANDPRQPQAAREAAAAHLKVMNDPMMSATLPGNRGTYNGPVSMYGSTVQALGLPTTVARRTPPPEAIAELRADPTGAAEFDEVFGTGSAARYLDEGGPPPPATGTFPH